ncbi:HMG box-containing protein 5-like isoform X2 [Homarus americanus]|uniref:Putative HMG-box domain-containing protein 2 n=2 Tax=Homarus americanus TaxID=6706 RepID=A0A8J5JRB6_HOMAM|nr:HMG box-containing protein 5-like isoform X2 [Homarus americanus]KAG7162857.1 putative HMG-box domain-containing protein 2 [Homarus americanus]
MKTVTPKQLSTMKRLKKDIRQKKERRYENKRGRLEKEEHGKPRAPGNAFFLFWMSLDQGELRRKEFLKEAARKWSSLGEEDQRPFFERADKLREQYFGELKEWEAQMAKAGNFHLIRPQHRVVYKLFQVQQDNQQED